MSLIVILLTRVLNKWAIDGASVFRSEAWQPEFFDHSEVIASTLHPLGNLAAASIG